MQTTQEAHFLLCVYLMLFFFCVDIAQQSLVAFHLTDMLIGGSVPHDAFLTLYGTVMGLFRGMMPDGVKESK